MDRKKVIKAIECCVVNHTRCFDDNDKLCPYFSTKVYMCEIELLKDALALLKDQREQLKTMRIANDVIADYLVQPQIVRCKDCKYWHQSLISGQEKFGDCGQANGITLKSSDWFCADGERRSNT